MDMTDGMRWASFLIISREQPAEPLLALPFDTDLADTSPCFLQRILQRLEDLPSTFKASPYSILANIKDSHTVVKWSL